MKIPVYKLERAKNWILSLIVGALPASVASAQPYAYVTASAGNSVAVVNTATQGVVANIDVCLAPNGVAVTPDGSLAYVTCTTSNSVAVISTGSNSVIATIPVSPTPVELAIAPNGTRVYVVNRDSNYISVISTSSQSVIGTIPVGSRPLAVAFSPDSSLAYVPNLWSGNVSIINTASQAVIGTFTAGSGPALVTAASNGRVYVANEYSNTVTVHDANGNLLGTIGGFTTPSAIAATPNGSRVFVINANGGSVSVIDTASNSLIATIPTGSIPTAVAISADGSYAYVTNEYSFSLSRISVATNTLVNNIYPVAVYPSAVAMQPAAGGYSAAPPPPPQTVCNYTLSQPSASFGSAGGTSSVNVSAPGGCGWTAYSNTGGITITAGSSGSGSGTVGFFVSPNSGVAPVNGSLTIAGQIFPISELGNTFSGIHVRAGGPSITDANGMVWTSDNAQNVSSTNAAIGNTPVPAIYQTEAWSNGTLQYQYSVPNGAVTVKLHFAEFYLTRAGERSFNILINGVTYYGGFDILGYTGPNTAYDVTIPVTVTNGQVLIQLVPVQGKAKIDALEIY